ncbi:restriction endonuclease subunit S (plasmid) [Synechococcus elongatus IITB7]|uniref:restriction endonuclease subunit S n=1 Tax=Synechococcus elongatus TaxID=32046 RepID=UPI0030CCE746
MELRAGYKLTEVGVIPEDWDVVFLDQVAKRGSGHTPNKKHPEYWNGDIKWVSLADSSSLDRLYISDTYAKITREGIANSSAVIHPVGTVVLSRDAGVGKSAIMQVDMAVSQHFMAWHCSNNLNNHFLYYWLQAEKKTFERIADGSTIKTIGLAYFKDLKIPYPSIPEQRAIAQALSDVDALIAGLERLIAKKRDIKQAAMQQLLTGQTRLPSFDQEWEIRSLSNLADIRSGGTPRTGDPKAWDGEIPWCTPTDITALDGKKYLLTTNRTITYHGLNNSSAEIIPSLSIVMTSRATIGECAINLVPMATNQGFKNFVPFDWTDGEFLYYLISSQKSNFISQCSGSTFLEIGKGSLLHYQVLVPPSKAEQSAIAEVLSDMDAELSALEDRLAKTRQIKQGMMQELLTGKTRLV